MSNTGVVQEFGFQPGMQVWIRWLLAESSDDYTVKIRTCGGSMISKRSLYRAAFSCSISFFGARISE